MQGATGTESTTDERVENRTDERGDDRALDLTEGLLSPDRVSRPHEVSPDGVSRADELSPPDGVSQLDGASGPDEVESSRPLVRHGSDLLDLVAGGVPFAVAHDVRGSTPRPAGTTDS